MKTVDPGVSMKRVRQTAIDTSAKIVIADDSEELAGGWTLATPHTTNTLRSFPFEEIVILLTDAAIYAVHFDWNTEKVASFERIDLRSIVNARQGVYITNTLTSAQMDTQHNFGLVLTYRPDKQNLMRINTRSMSTFHPPEGLNKETPEDVAEASEPTPPQETDMERSSDKSKDLRVLALKALPAQSIVSSGSKDVGDTLTEKEFINDVCRQIVAITGQPEGWVEEKDIISLAEAKRSTGLFEQLGHSLKKLVWA